MSEDFNNQIKDYKQKISSYEAKSTILTAVKCPSTYSYEVYWAIYSLFLQDESWAVQAHNLLSYNVQYYLGRKPLGDVSVSQEPISRQQLENAIYDYQKFATSFVRLNPDLVAQNGFADLMIYAFAKDNQPKFFASASEFFIGKLQQDEPCYPVPTNPIEIKYPSLTGDVHSYFQAIKQNSELLTYLYSLELSGNLINTLDEAV